MNKKYKIYKNPEFLPQGVIDINTGIIELAFNRIRSSFDSLPISDKIKSHNRMFENSKYDEDKKHFLLKIISLTQDKIMEDHCGIKAKRSKKLVPRNANIIYT